MAREAVKKFWDSDVVASREVWCALMKGRKPDTVRKKIVEQVQQLEKRSPGILVLHDLDLLTPVPEGEDQTDPHVSLASWLADKMVEMQRDSKIKILATARASSSLHPLLQSSGGNIPFHYEVEVHLPGKEARRQMLASLLNASQGAVNNRGTKDEKEIPFCESIPAPHNLALPDDFDVATEGFSPGDLVVLAKRLKGKKRPTEERIRRELASFVPRSRWGQDLEAPSHASLAQVGGFFPGLIHFSFHL